MVDRALFSIKTATDFIEKCLRVCAESQESLEKIGRIELPDDCSSWKRIKILIYLSHSIYFFKQRIEFFLKCLDSENINRDIVETVFRGLVEIYCRILFVLKSDETDVLKKIIWQDYYLIGLTNIDIRKVKEAEKIVSLNTKILESISIELPGINVLRNSIQARLIGAKKDKAFKNLEKQYRFPGVRNTLMKYYDEKEEPPIPRYWLYRRYCELSEQIHGNFLMEYYGENPKSDYRIIAFLVILSLKFLTAISQRTHTEEDVIKLIAEFREFAPIYLKLWRLSGHL